MAATLLVLSGLRSCRYFDLFLLLLLPRRLLIRDLKLHILLYLRYHRLQILRHGLLRQLEDEVALLVELLASDVIRRDVDMAVALLVVLELDELVRGFDLNDVMLRVEVQAGVGLLD